MIRNGDEVFNWKTLNNNKQTNQGGFMKEDQNIEARLWDFIDGLATPDEKSAIEKLIQTNHEWQLKYKEMLGIHQMMFSSELEEPSLRFTKNVMEEITKYQIAPATKSYINKKIVWGIGGFFILMFFGFLVYGMKQMTWSDSGSSTLFSQMNLKKLDWSKFFNNTYMTIFMLINVVLGLVLLDMYLERKKNQPGNKET
jgi:hypothetical protein